MKHDCPYCGASLKWRLVTSKPLPGERKILPSRAVTVCPSCGGQLAPNTHWSEFGFFGIVLLPFLFLRELNEQLGSQALVVVLGASLLFVGVAALFLHRRYWRHMQRYKPYVPRQNAR